MTAALAHRIEAAFAARDRPQDRVVTDPAHCPECARVDAALLGRDWRALAPDELLHHREALSLMTPAAFHYYLPAFLLESLRDNPGSIDVMDYAVFALSAPAPELADYWHPRVRGLTLDERAAVTALLHHLAGARPPREAPRYTAALAYLDSLWR